MTHPKPYRVHSTDFKGNRYYLASFATYEEASAFMRAPEQKSYPYLVLSCDQSQYPSLYALRMEPVVVPSKADFIKKWTVN